MALSGAALNIQTRDYEAGERRDQVNPIAAIAVKSYNWFLVGAAAVATPERAIWCQGRGSGGCWFFIRDIVPAG